MLRAALFIARKDVQYMLRERETLAWTFIMPLVFFWFIGTVTGGFGGGSGGGQDTLALRVPEPGGFLVERLTARLEDQDFNVVRPEDPAVFEQYRRRLDLPEGFTASVLAGQPVRLQLRRRGEGTGADLDELRASLAVYTLLADLVLAHEEGRPLTAALLDELAARPRPLQLAVESAGERAEVPSGFAQAIPGTMVMFTMMLLLTSGAVLLVIERHQGLLRRMASAPVSRGAVVLGKWGGKMALAIVQLAFAMLAGKLLFEMTWGPSLPMVLVVLFGWAAFNASLGILMGSLASSEGHAVGLAVTGTMLLAALGGCWWPIEVTPPWMQQLAMFLPTGWVMDALHQLVHFGHAPASALPHALGVYAGALLLGALAARRFRFQ